jgi:Dockerin type I domain
MKRTFAFRRLFLLCPLVLQFTAPSETKAQLSGTYRSAPGSLAIYTYHHGEYESVPLPADVTMRFSGNDPTTTLTAIIHKPIIGDLPGTNYNYSIVHEFPMIVTGTSTDGHRFTGDLLSTQYLFDWTIEPVNSRTLRWDGRVGWSGGRIEVSTIDEARLIPLAPGDYNQNGAVDAADFIVWRKAMEQSGTSAAGLFADGDFDGHVDEDDYQIWRTHFGETSTSGALAATGIPEPATWLMLAVALMPLMNMACRRIRA